MIKNACFFAMTAVLTVPNVYAEPLRQSELVQLPGYGPVTVRAEGDNDKIPLHLVFKDAKGNELADIHFSPWDDAPYEQDAVRFEVVHVDGIEMPLIAATAIDPGASDGRLESTVIGVVDGRLTDLLSPHGDTNYEGDLCLGTYGSDHTPGIFKINFVWGKDEGHFQPHRFEYALYLWDGKRFAPSLSGKTKKKYEGPHEALKDLGYRYDRDIPYDLFKNEF